MRKARKFKKISISRKVWPDYDFVYNSKTNNFDIKKVGETDVDAYIQSFAASTGVHNVVARFKATQDVSLLKQRSPIYGDVSGIPDNPIDFRNRSEDATSKVDSFVKQFGYEKEIKSPEDFNAFVEYMNKKVEEAKKEVKKNEQ